jgi:phosphoglycerate dehydrogenase-like enzyme
MPKIVLYPRPAPDVLAIGESLAPTGYDFVVADPADGPAGIAAKLVGAEYLVGFIGNLPAEAWSAGRDLKLVQLLSAGYDNFPIPTAREMRLPVSTNGGANAIAVAEHAVMLMLAVYRHLTVLDRRVREGIWRAALRGEAKYHEIAGKRVGVLGFGQIGRGVAKRLRGFDAELFYFDVRRLASADEAALGVTYLPLEELVATVDVVSLHLPLLPETRRLVDAAFIAKMRPGSILINTARGELVDEAALAAALRDGPLAGAGLDVLAQEPPAKDNPLFALENVVITPHSAGPTWESWPRRFANAFANVERVAGGDRPLWVIPELRGE